MKSPSSPSCPLKHRLILAFYSVSVIATACDLALLAFGAVSLSVISELRPAQFLVVLGILQLGVFGLLVETGGCVLVALQLLKCLDLHAKLVKYLSIGLVVSCAVMVAAHSYVAFFHFQSNSSSAGDLSSEDDCLDSEVLSSLQLTYDLAQAVMDSGCPEDSVLDCECYSAGLCLDDLDLEVQLLTSIEQASDCGGFCSPGLRLFSNGESSSTSCRESLQAAIDPVFTRSFSILIIAAIALAVVPVCLIVLIVTSFKQKLHEEQKAQEEDNGEADSKQPSVEDNGEADSKQLSFKDSEVKSRSFVRMLPPNLGESSIKYDGMRTSELLSSQELSIIQEMRRSRVPS
jgi:flagellar basal body-associated protein FliL